METKIPVYEIPLFESREYRKLFGMPRQDVRPLEERVFQRVKSWFERDGLDVSQLVSCRVKSHSDFERAIKTGYPLSNKEKQEVLDLFLKSQEEKAREYVRPVCDLNDVGKGLKGICRDLLWDQSKSLGYVFYNQEDRTKRTYVGLGFGGIGVSIDEIREGAKPVAILRIQSSALVDFWNQITKPFDNF
jgi:hypothetical protein